MHYRLYRLKVWEGRAAGLGKGEAGLREGGWVFRRPYEGGMF